MLLAKMPDGSPEIYKAVQGEGPSTGKLCVFVRTSTCNLQCNFCDTSYTWMFESLGESKLLQIGHIYSKPVAMPSFVIKMSPEEIAAKIIEEAGPHFKRVIFSGGEPMLQQKEIMEVVEILKKDYHHWDIEVETNGTIKPMEGCKFMTQINCSPKLGTSGNSEAMRHKPEVIAKFLEMLRNAEVHHLGFKFVVHCGDVERTKSDLAEIEAWEKETGVPRSLIYIMPEGITEDQIKKGTYVVHDICREKGYQFSTRLHVLLYGDKRAV